MRHNVFLVFKDLILINRILSYGVVRGHKHKKGQNFPTDRGRNDGQITSN